MADSDPSSSSKTGFFDLPLELRDEIYQLVLADSLDIHLCRDCQYHCSKFPFLPTLHQTPSLLSVSRQVRHETIETLSAKAMIHTHLSTLSFDANQKLPETLSEKDLGNVLVKMARHFRFHFWAECELVVNGGGIRIMTVGLHIFKQQGRWSAELVFGDHLSPREWNNFLRTKRNEELARRLSSALEEPLAKLQGSSMTYDFMHALPGIILKAEQFEMEVVGSEMVGFKDL